jgi:hypothetical protein
VSLGRGRPVLVTVSLVGWWVLPRLPSPTLPPGVVKNLVSRVLFGRLCWVSADFPGIFADFVS